MSTAGEIAGRNVSGIIGILHTSVAIGTLVGPSAAVFDVSHSYTLPILASVAANIVAAGIAALTMRASLRTTATGQHTRQ